VDKVIWEKWVKSSCGELSDLFTKLGRSIREHKYYLKIKGDSLLPNGWLEKIAVTNLKWCLLSLTSFPPKKKFS